MAKHFSNITQMEGWDKNISDEFYIECNMEYFISNTLLRSIMSDIETYTINPESIQFHTNTSCWDNELLKKQLEYIPISKKQLENKDINMIEIELKVENKNMEYVYVYSDEIIIKNIEKDNILNTKDIMYTNIPLCLLGYNEEIHLTCKLEYDTKINTNSRHQAANVGMYYENSNKIRFLINQQTGIEPRDMITEGLQRIFVRLDNLCKNIESANKEKVHIQYNAKMRYDFILVGETIIGNLIEYWNNRNSKNVVVGCRRTMDQKSVIIDFGVKEFSEKGKEKEITKVFLQLLQDIKTYIMLLVEDSKKIKVKSVSNSKYLEDINKFRRNVM